MSTQQNSYIKKAIKKICCIKKTIGLGKKTNIEMSLLLTVSYRTSKCNISYFVYFSYSSPIYIILKQRK